MEREAAQRRYDNAHKDLEWHDGTFKNWSHKSSAAFPYRYDDGVTIVATTVDLSPDDDFLSTPKPMMPNGGGHDGGAP